MDKEIVANFENLYRSYKKVKSGKKFNSGTARFSNLSLEGIHSADECTVQDDDANFNAGDSWDELMKGCPLKPLPEKMTGVAQTDHWNSIKAGWNACIDEITGRGDSDD